VLSRMEAGLSGTIFLDPSEDLWLGELMLLLGSSARMECNFRSFVMGTCRMNYMKF
jgi:hypothetical protein